MNYLVLKIKKKLISEKFIRILKNGIHKCMIGIGNNVYIDKLDNMVSNYNDAVHSKIKMNPKDVTPDTLIEYILM